MQEDSILDQLKQMSQNESCGLQHSLNASVSNDLGGRNEPGMLSVMLEITGRRQ